MAQSLALVRQLPLVVLCNGVGVLVAAAIALNSGAPWIIGPGVLIIWVLLVPLAASWLRLRGRLPPQAVSERRIRRINVYSGILGLAWGVLAVVYGPLLPQDTRIFLMVALLAQGILAVAGFHFLPLACLAYSVPAFLGTMWVIWTTVTHAPYVPVLMLATMGGMVWVLKVNWARFDDQVSLSTEKSAQSEKLQAQKEVAEASVVLKTRFLAAASHDLRQPMHAISLYLGALSESQLPPSAREVVLDAKECAHHMNDMFRALLDISRLDTQRMEPQAADTPIGAILARVKMEYQPLATAKGLAFKVRESNAHVFTDAVMAERILMNFVSNAIRYTRHGKVLVACRKRGQFLRVEVYDTGPGIDPSQQDAIFDEFYRGPDAQRESAGGLGLGLAIVHRLAAAMGAPLTLRSRPGKGSLFCVELPLAAGVSPTPAPRAEPGLPVRGLSNAMVVVIDDEPTVLGAAVFLLREAGCSVVGGLSFEEVMAKLSTNPRAPDVIVCDYQLREGQNGIEVIQTLREEFNLDIPALLITGDTSGSLQGALARAPGLPVLHKPLMAESFRQAVAGLMETSSGVRAAHSLGDV